MRIDAQPAVGSGCDCTAVPDGLIARLTQIWETALRITPIATDQNYFDLGCDSISAIELFTVIENEWKIKLPLSTLFDAPTIDQLAVVLWTALRISRPL